MSRFQRVGYLAIPHDTVVRELVRSACLHALDVKDSTTGATESVVKATLQAKFEDFTGPHASAAQRAAAPYLPKTFKQALTMLTDIAGCEWPKLIRYDMCPCGFIYRGPDYRDATQCGGLVPGRRAGEWVPCPKARADAKYMTYNPIGGFCRRIYNNSEIAAEFAGWQTPERMKNDGQLRDICDASVVAKLLASDPWFEDPRCLVTLIASDAFVVGA
jgi:hypothetical protein